MGITFLFAGLSGVNSGIIATIFSTCVVFTAVIFKLKYGQILSKMDWVGCITIIVCVVLIGIGGAQGGEGQKIDTTDLLMAVLCAVITGFVFSLNTLNVNYVIRDVGFPPNQMNFDGSFLFGLVLLPFFLVELI